MPEENKELTEILDQLAEARKVKLEKLKRHLADEKEKIERETQGLRSLEF